MDLLCFLFLIGVKSIHRTPRAKTDRSRKHQSILKLLCGVETPNFWPFWIEVFCALPESSCYLISSADAVLFWCWMDTGWFPTSDIWTLDSCINGKYFELVPQLGRSWKLPPQTYIYTVRFGERKMWGLPKEFLALLLFPWRGSPALSGLMNESC